MRADQQIEVPVSLDQWPENPVFWPTRGFPALLPGTPPQVPTDQRLFFRALRPQSFSEPWCAPARRCRGHLTAQIHAQPDPALQDSLRALTARARRATASHEKRSCAKRSSDKSYCLFLLRGVRVRAAWRIVRNFSLSVAATISRRRVRVIYCAAGQVSLLSCSCSCIFIRRLAMSISKTIDEFVHEVADLYREE